MDIKWMLSFQMTGWFCGGIYIVLVILSLVSWALIFHRLALLLSQNRDLFAALRNLDSHFIIAVRKL